VATSKTGIKRKPLSLSEKLHIIQKVDGFPSVPRTKICKELGIPVSTVNTIMLNRNKILKQLLTQQPGRKRMKTGKYEKVEAVLTEWFRQKRALNLTINGRILKSKAEEIAMKLNIEFRPSKGWIDRFKKRSGIVYRKFSGEANSANPEEVEAWKGRILPHLMAKYSPKDIFNADECGLFYNMLPDKTYTFKGASRRGIKVNKERITILVCANLDGTEKLPLLIVGKSKQPQCFKNTKFLPCTYRHNKAAWMTCEIFHEFLVSLDRRMASKSRKILLFVDHCPAHPKDVGNFKNVRVEFIPANMTSLLQPMDQGIIKALKKRFRRSFVLRLLQRRNFTEDGCRMSLLDAVSMLAVAWNSVGRDTVASSFRKAGFSTTAEAAEQDGDGDGEVSCDAWSSLQEKLNIRSTFEEFVRADDALPPCGELDLDQLCDNVTSSPEELEMDGPVAYDCPSVPTCSEAMEYLEKYDHFLQSNTNVPEDVVKSLWNLKMYTETVFENKCKTHHA